MQASRLPNILGSRDGCTAIVLKQRSPRGDSYGKWLPEMLSPKRSSRKTSFFLEDGHSGGPSRSRPLLLLVVLATLMSSAGVAPGAGPPVTGGDTAALVRRVAEAGVPRTVGIVCNRQKYESFYGAGAILSPDGYIITSTTVVPAGAEEIKVYFDGAAVHNAKIVETSDDLEATVLKIGARDLPCFPVTREVPELGTAAFTFSNAHNTMEMGGRASFSMGVVSGYFEVENLGGESCYHGPAIETSAAVNPGSRRRPGRRRTRPALRRSQPERFARPMAGR